MDQNTACPKTCFLKHLVLFPFSGAVSDTPALKTTDEEPTLCRDSHAEIRKFPTGGPKGEHFHSTAPCASCGSRRPSEYCQLRPAEVTPASDTQRVDAGDRTSPRACTDLGQALLAPAGRRALLRGLQPLPLQLHHLLHQQRAHGRAALPLPGLAVPVQQLRPAAPQSLHAALRGERTARGPLVPRWGGRPGPRAARTPQGFHGSGVAAPTAGGPPPARHGGTGPARSGVGKGPGPARLTRRAGPSLAGPGGDGTGPKERAEPPAPLTRR